jgi:hypothetical protein
MDILARCYRKSPNLVFRRIADEYVLVPIHHDVADMEAVYTVAGVGVRIWELLDGEQDGYTILEQILEEYEVTPEEAQADLVEFLEQLEAIEGIVPTEAQREA